MATKLSPGSKLVSYIKRHSEAFFLVLFFFVCWGFIYATVGGPSNGDHIYIWIWHLPLELLGAF